MQEFPGQKSYLQISDADIKEWNDISLGLEWIFWHCLKFLFTQNNIICVLWLKSFELMVLFVFYNCLFWIRIYKSKFKITDMRRKEILY